MSVRFVIRKDGSAQYPWAFRDALCARAESHDFLDWGWGADCEGYCNAFESQPEAVEELKWAKP